MPAPLQDLKLKRIAQETFDGLALEILTSLKNMGEVLTPPEQAIFNAIGGAPGFLRASDTHVGEGAEGNLLAAAAQDVHAAN